MEASNMKNAEGQPRDAEICKSPYRDSSIRPMEILVT
jgi:hypothetical protein